MKMVQAISVKPKISYNAKQDSKYRNLSECFLVRHNLRFRRRPFYLCNISPCRMQRRMKLSNRFRCNSLFSPRLQVVRISCIVLR
jgi:hypothetical protein